MPVFNKNFELTSRNRKDARREIVLLFLEEENGTGIGELTNRYNYYVERYNDYRVILKRPTRLNKGFDFTVNAPGLWFRANRRQSNPKHEHIIEALESVKISFPNSYHLVAEQINNIFLMNDYSFEELDNITFIDCNGDSRPIAMVLLLLKWLFLEQDITYWNGMGRYMFMEKLSKLGLV